MGTTKIEWTASIAPDGTIVPGYTFNPVIGCQNVSPGCDHCYAEAMTNRYGWTEWGPHGVRKRTSDANWRKPLQWAKQARGTRPRVFCASLADVFDNRWPAGARPDLFSLIRKTPELDWLLLTKRPQNISKMLPPDWGDGYRNVWLGTTCEDQERYDLRWPVLANIPARIRFISYEPAIGPLTYIWGKPDWIICGGESGPGARDMDPAWAGTVRDQCAASGIAFFMKQMTRKAPIPADLLIRQWPEAA